MTIQGIMQETLLCKSKKYLLCYHRGRIIIKDISTAQNVLSKRINSYKRSFPIIARLFRFVPRAAVHLGDDVFLFSHHGAVYRCSPYDNAISIDHKFGKGMNNPLTFCTRYDENGSLVSLLYGEYIGNRDRGPVSIYSRTLTGWTEVYAFPAHSIQHIHNIVFDKFRNRYLIMTGDMDEESGIWEADVNFSNVRPLVKGSQKYRACVLFPTSHCVYYATDTPLEQNFVYCLDEENKIHEIAEMPGPCIFGIEKKGCLYFATSVEGDPTLGKWRYRFSDKLGRGVRDRYSHLFRISQNGIVEEIGKMEKDRMPMWLFEFGNMKFPVSEDEQVYICPQSLKAKYGTYVLS